MSTSGKISGSFLGRIAKVGIISVVIVVILFWLIMLITNGGTFLREDEAKAACYALVAQKYPDARVHTYTTEREGFGELHVESTLTAPDPNQIIGEVDLHYDCLVQFRTGFPQARLTRLDVTH
jgi:hypothetical protein